MDVEEPGMMGCGLSGGFGGGRKRPLPATTTPMAQYDSSAPLSVSHEFVTSLLPCAQDRVIIVILLDQLGICGW